MKRVRSVGLVLAVFAVAFSAAAVGAATGARLTGEVVINAPTEDGAPGDYAYSGPLGPAQWGRLDARPGADNTVCQTGKRQSPINLRLNDGRGTPETAAPPADPIELDYRATELEIENLGSTIEFPYGRGSTMTVGDDIYELLQFHLHARSEHTIQGKTYPLEIHLVHRNVTGANFAVLGIMVEEGEENEAFAEFGSAAELAQMIPGDQQVAYEFPTLELNVGDLIPEDLTTYRYQGSLTTPPCSEVVNWHVLATPITMSADQLAMFEEEIADLRATQGGAGKNHRPIQKLNGREVILVEG